MGVLHYADQFGHKRHLVVHGKGGSLPPGLVALAVGEGVLVGDVVRAPPLDDAIEGRNGEKQWERWKQGKQGKQWTQWEMWTQWKQWTK